MSTTISGQYVFEDTPTVNGNNVLVTGGNTGTITTGTFAARPAASVSGNLYIDTTNNYIWEDNGTSWVQLSTGKVLQTVTGTIAATTGTTQITTAVTAAPTITDGFQIWTQSFTPISASSKLIIEFNLTISHSTASRVVVLSVFSGSTNIGSVAATNTATANNPSSFGFYNTFSPASTATITISARIGGVGAGTLSIEQYNGTTNTLGGKAVTSYTITEVL